MKLGVLHSMEATTNQARSLLQNWNFLSRDCPTATTLGRYLVDAINLSGDDSWRSGQTTPETFWSKCLDY